MDRFPEQHKGSFRHEQALIGYWLAYHVLVYMAEIPFDFTSIQTPLHFAAPPKSHCKQVATLYAACYLYGFDPT